MLLCLILFYGTCSQFMMSVPIPPPEASWPIKADRCPVLYHIKKNLKKQHLCAALRCWAATTTAAAELARRGCSNHGHRTPCFLQLCVFSKALPVEQVFPP